MDDTPRHFVEELKSSIFKKRVGQIALAVVLAEACLRFLNAVTWFLVVPAVGNVLNGHTESVLFDTKQPFPVQQLFGSLLDFGLAIIFVFYVNRWVNKKPLDSDSRALTEPATSSAESSGQVVEGGKVQAYNLVGQPVDSAEDD
jgi:large-conductance mechanosensitive channel